MNFLKGPLDINTSCCASLHPSPLDYYHSQLWHVLTHRLMTTCQVCQLRHLRLRFPLTTLKHTHTEQENTQMHENTITNMCRFYIWWKLQNAPYMQWQRISPQTLPFEKYCPAPYQGFLLHCFLQRECPPSSKKGSKECWQKLSKWHIQYCSVCCSLHKEQGISDNICIGSLHLTNFVIWNTATSNSDSWADWQLRV